MIVLNKAELVRFVRRHADARKSIERWIHDIETNEFQTLQDLKEYWPKASILAGNRVIFNIKGNDYRLFAYLNFARQELTVLKVGTHQEYDRWNL